MTVFVRKRLPAWLRRSLPGESADPTHDVLRRHDLNTVCESAICPNRTECYAGGTATFMILGDVCTRSCGFCAIETGKGLAVEADEPERVAEAAREMGLRYVVLTSVARDDLADQGAGHFARTIRAVREAIAGVRVEVLVPDFHARKDLIEEVLAAEPHVYNHNVETVARLQSQVRRQASYGRSLDVLRRVKEIDPDMLTKSGIMLGLGETFDEVRETGRDLRRAGCDILTVGQYLAPSTAHLKTIEYISPEQFEKLGNSLREMGFRSVFAGPYVRSSYHAGETFSTAAANCGGASKKDEEDNA